MQARSAVQCRSARLSEAVSPAKSARVAIGLIVVKSVAKSLLILIKSGDMTINPIATLALFAGLTASLSRADRHWTALRACIYATIILVVAMTAGQVILDAIGIHMHSLKVAGGIILFLFGVQMLFGKMDAKTQGHLP